jgi:hypothetical protein
MWIFHTLLFFWLSSKLRARPSRLSTISLNLVPVVRVQVFTAVNMKNAVFWDMTPCGSCKIRSFGGTYHLHHQDEKNQGARNKVRGNKQLKQVLP